MMFVGRSPEAGRLVLLAGTALGSLLSVAVPAIAQQVDSGKPIALPTLQVEGQSSTDYKVDQPSLTKLTQPIVDTPQVVETVSRQLMDDRGTTTLNDAMRNVPGISLGAGETSWLGTNLTLRGFNARNDIFLDGMRDFGSYYRDPFDLEEVEVLEGPSSILFGRGSTGGVVNQVSKAPTLQSHIEGELAFGTDNTRRLTADIDQPLPELGEGVALRLPVMLHDSQVAGRDEGRYRRYGAAPSLAFGLGTPTRVTVSYLHQVESDLPDYGIPWLRGKPAPVPLDTFYGYKSDYLNTDADVVTLKAEHDFNDTITVTNKLRYADYYRSWRDTEPLVATAGVTAATPLSSIVVNRNIQGGHSREYQLIDQLDATVKFNTGDIGHTLVTGFEIGPESSDPTYNNSLGAPATGLFSPNTNLPFAATVYPKIAVHTEAFTAALYAIDTVKIGEQWEITGGVRWDHFESDYHARNFASPPAAFDTVTSVQAFNQVDAKPSYRASIVYKPLPNGSVYFDYGTSFNPSAESLSQIVAARSLSVANEGQSPEKNRTFEVGTKWEVMDKRMLVTGALFREDKYNARVPNPLNSQFNILGGDQQVDGVDIEIQGRITDAWQINAGYTYLDGHVIKSAPGAAPVGAGLFNAPKNALSLWTSYQLPQIGNLGPIEVGGGLSHVSSRLGSNTIPNETAPGYTTVDLMANYQITEQLKLQVNVYNVGDVYYYDALHGFHIIPGAARSALFSLGYKM